MVCIAQRAQARRAQQEVATARSGGPEPASNEHLQEMPVRTPQHIPLDGAHPTDHTVSLRADLVRRSPARATVRNSCQLGRSAWIATVRRPSWSPEFHSSRSPSTSATVAKLASSYVRAARCMGLVNTLANVNPR